MYPAKHPLEVRPSSNFGPPNALPHSSGRALEYRCRQMGRYGRHVRERIGLSAQRTGCDPSGRIEIASVLGSWGRLLALDRIFVRQETPRHSRIDDPQTVAAMDPLLTGLSPGVPGAICERSEPALL